MGCFAAAHLNGLSALLAIETSATYAFAQAFDEGKRREEMRFTLMFDVFEVSQ
jgi:hypothetical protein